MPNLDFLQIQSDILKQLATEAASNFACIYDEQVQELAAIISQNADQDSNPVVETMPEEPVVTEIPISVPALTEIAPKTSTYPQIRNFSNIDLTRIQQDLDAAKKKSLESNAIRIPIPVASSTMVLPTVPTATKKFDRVVPKLSRSSTLSATSELSQTASMNGKRSLESDSNSHPEKRVHLNALVEENVPVNPASSLLVPADTPSVGSTKIAPNPVTQQPITVKQTSLKTSNSILESLAQLRKGLEANRKRKESRLVEIVQPIGSTQDISEVDVEKEIERELLNAQEASGSKVPKNENPESDVSLPLTAVVPTDDKAQSDDKNTSFELYSINVMQAAAHETPEQVVLVDPKTLMSATIETHAAEISFQEESMMLDSRSASPDLGENASMRTPESKTVMKSELMEISKKEILQNQVPDNIYSGTATSFLPVGNQKSAPASKIVHSFIPAINASEPVRAKPEVKSLQMAAAAAKKVNYVN